MSVIYGYARCSLSEEHGQDLNRQSRELKAAGAEIIAEEREHGFRNHSADSPAVPQVTMVTIKCSALVTYLNTLPASKA